MDAKDVRLRAVSWPEACVLTILRFVCLVRLFHTDVGIIVVDQARYKIQDVKKTKVNHNNQRAQLLISGEVVD